jgi:hypothetical protein
MARDSGSDLKSSLTFFGALECYEITGSQCSGSNWPFTLTKAPFISPDIFDADKDGKYDILFPEWKSSKVYLIKGNGGIFTFKVGGEIGSAPAIGDLDKDGMAEVAVKRAGSPVNLLTAISDFNEGPFFFETIANITGIAGAVLDINKSGDVVVTDPNGNQLSLTYSSPFNATGIWLTTVNDTGNYTTFVEASDGNLTDVKAVNVMVLPPDAALVNTFKDGSSQKSLSFTGTESKTATVRLPKDATVIFSRIRAQGRSP